MDVKTAGRTLHLFEVFTAERRPLSLSDLARAINAPVSSAFALVKTLESRGYLHALNSRRVFYPTRKMLANAAAIARHDPLLLRVMPVLESLHQATGETVILARRASDRVVYVEVLESPHSVRYTANAGDLQYLHASAAGKAILSRLARPERAQLLAGLDLRPVTPDTITGRAALEREIAASATRGWFRNRGENIADVMAVAAPVSVDGECYAISVAGPIHRFERHLDRHVNDLLDAGRRLDTGVAAAETTAPRGRLPAIVRSNRPTTRK